jgi:hypothetical protein
MNLFNSLFSGSKPINEPEMIEPLVELPNQPPLLDDTEIMNQEGPNEPVKKLPEITEELFVEHSAPGNSNEIQQRKSIKMKAMDTTEKTENHFDLQYLYSFLERDYQQEGYSDALANPDMSSMEEKVKLIRRQLEITIAKVTTHYSTLHRNINFHIESRSRNGMVDIVDELISKKATIEEEMDKVQQIAQGSKSESGISETLIMSYKLGFKNGYAAISHSQLI